MQASSSAPHTTALNTTASSFLTGTVTSWTICWKKKSKIFIISSVDVNSHITGDLVGKCLEAEEDARRLYEQHLLETVNYKLDGKKIVLDCANGAAYQIAPQVYRALGAAVTVIGDQPNGVNHQCCLRVNASGGSGCKST